MGAIPFAESRFGCKDRATAPVVAEVEGLIRVYKDGVVDRLPVVVDVPCGFMPEPDVTSTDVIMNRSTGQWARVYVPATHRMRSKLLPLLIYFHGGGFCLGSAAWRCYHEFLAKVASHANCMVVSVNYRLAPEHRLPAAYDDGLSAVEWVLRQGSRESSCGWCSLCDFSRVFIGGDSAGANVSHNVAIRILQKGLRPLSIKGLVYIQPFFGGEARTRSERNADHPANSALTLATSDIFWQLALPVGTNREHPFCNPLTNSAAQTLLNELHLPPLLVCISDMDILKDRNLELCSSLRKAGKKVEHHVYGGVGHAFQVLHNYPTSETRSMEMLSHISTFIEKL